MSDQELERAKQRLEKNLAFIKGKKAATDEAVAYAIDTGGDINVLHKHIQRIRHDRTCPLRILPHTFPTWEPDYEDQDFLAGIWAGCDAIEQIYNAPDWQIKPWPIASGAPSKVVHDLRIALLEIDGYLDGLQVCLENMENFEAIRFEIKDLKNYFSHGYRDRLLGAKLQAIEDGYATLVENLEGKIPLS